MIDYLRNLTKSAEDKQREALNAYLDDALSPKERRQFEQLLGQDADLQAEVSQHRLMQTQLRQLPRRRVPRNFTLDPAVYGRPQRQPLFQLYPAMRVATVLTAFFFILAVATDLFMTQTMSAPFGTGQDIAMTSEQAVEDSMAQAPEAGAMNAVEVTRVVSELIVESETAVEAGEAVELMEAPAEEMMAEAEEEALFAGEPAVEEPAAEEPAEELALPAAAESVETDDALLDSDAADTERNGSAPAMTASPAPTPALAPLAIVTATKSTIPRPATETTTSERAATVVPTIEVEVADETAAEETAVWAADPIDGLRFIQIGLGVLLIILVTAVLYIRRQL